MFDIIVAYLPGLNHYDIDGEGWRGEGGGGGWYGQIFFTM